MRERKIAPGLSYNSGEVRGLFCKVVDARGPSPRGPHRGPSRARARYVAWAARVGYTGEFIFLFHKELEIVF